MASITPTSSMCAASQDRNPLSVPAELHHPDLVTPERTGHLAFLVAQNSGENQPACGFELRQNLNQQFAKQIRGNDVDLRRQFPMTYLASLKLRASNFVQSRVLFRRRNRDRIIVDSDRVLRAELARGQRKNSAARSEIDNGPAGFPTSRNLFEQSERHCRRRVLASAKSCACRNDQPRTCNPE